MEKYKSGFLMPTDIPFEEQESLGMNGNHAGPAGESPPVSSGRPRSRSAIRVDSLRSTMSSGATRSRKRAGFFGIFGRVGRAGCFCVLGKLSVDTLMISFCRTDALPKRKSKLWWEAWGNAPPIILLGTMPLQ